MSINLPHKYWYPGEAVWDPSIPPNGKRIKFYHDGTSRCLESSQTILRAPLPPFEYMPCERCYRVIGFGGGRVSVGDGFTAKKSACKNKKANVRVA